MLNPDQPDSTVTEIGAGAQFGPYLIEARLGAGGMGQVFRARDTRLGRMVALKVCNAKFSDRFEREARAIAALNHPHICTLHDVGPNYLVMELVEGAPLKGPLAVEKAVEYAGQILDALDVAHRKGITHRDLKPANILVNKSGVKVLDFGLADIAGDPKLTRAGAVMGTPAYMAPEQWEGKVADARSDIYSFGCVLYEMLTGKRAAKERMPVASPALESVIATCLENDPEDRWQTARDIKRALTLPVTVTVQPQRNKWWIAVTALAVIGFSVWAIERFRSPVEQETVRRLNIEPPSGGHFALAGNSNVGGMALSPDGKAATYVATVGEQTGLWIQPLDGAPRLLAGTESAGYPFWAPDGKSIAFFAKGKLQSVAAAGGAASTLAEMPDFRGGVWLSDGRIVFGTTASPLRQVSTANGPATSLTELDASRGELAHVFPQALPGDRVLYLALSSTPENSGVYAISLARPAEKVRVLSTAVNALWASDHLLWWDGGTLLAQRFDPATLKLAGDALPLAQQVSLHDPVQTMNVALSSNGLLLYDASGFQRQLRWFDPSGKMLGPAGDLTDAGNFRISPDGRRVAAVTSASANDVWITDENGLSNRLTTDRAAFRSPVWSPDGRSMIVSILMPPYNLFRIDANAAGAGARLTTSPNTQFASDWSRDGRFVLYYENAPGTQRDLWVLPVTSEGNPVGEPRLYLQTPANESWAQFSPEPNPGWVSYQSDLSGRFEIYIQAFPNPGRQFRISAAGGSYPKWGPEGRELYYMSPQNKLVAATLRLGAESVEVLARRELMPLPPADSGAGSPPFDVTPDGKRFVVRTVTQSTEALTVVTNWPALLTKGKQ